MTPNQSAAIAAADAALVGAGLPTVGAMVHALSLCHRYVNGGHRLYPGLHAEAYEEGRDVLRSLPLDLLSADLRAAFDALRAAGMSPAWRGDDVAVTVPCVPPLNTTVHTLRQARSAILLASPSHPSCP